MKTLAFHPFRVANLGVNMGFEEQNLPRTVVAVAICYHLHVSKKELTKSHFLPVVC